MLREDDSRFAMIVSIREQNFVGICRDLQKLHVFGISESTISIGTDVAFYCIRGRANIPFPISQSTVKREPVHLAGIIAVPVSIVIRRRH